MACVNHVWLYNPTPGMYEFHIHEVIYWAVRPNSVRMSTEQGTARRRQEQHGIEPWQAGVVGGLLGGLLFGVIMSIQTPTVLETAIPSGLYGLPESSLVGWMVHMSHGAILGVGFAVVVELGGLDDTLDTNLKHGGAAFVYGLFLWGLLAAVVMPFWVSGGSTAGVPNIATESIVGHMVYGTSLGIAYSVLAD